MPRYELMYLLGSHVAETDVPALSAQVLKTLNDLGAENVQETQLGKKKLAYPIKKTRNGFYVVVDFSLNSRKVSEFDAKIRAMDTSIIRYIIVNLEEHLDRMAKDKVEQAKIVRKIPAEKAQEKPRTETPKPAIKLEDIDEKIEKALSEDLTK